MNDDFASTGTQLYSQFIHRSRYARWLPEEGRREIWDETVSRYIKFFSEKFPDFKDDIVKLKPSIKNLDVMPSMRALMTAGPALKRDEVAGYGCSYAAIDHPRVFDEIMYILMCGTGVGFSVERQYVNQLPEVAEEFYATDTMISVPDSKIGWAKSFRELISLCYVGHIPKWDLSKLRPEGTPLKVFGGRSSGPDPLDQLFHFTVDLFSKAKGRKLSSIECHDLTCKIADVVVCGGVRRAALLSLSNLSDDRMRLAKSGQWWIASPHRQLANNSAAYTEKPEFEVFLKEWQSLYSSKSGERGFFSRLAAEKQVLATNRREIGHSWGLNPCAEIILRPGQFCNLSEVVVRPGDSLDFLSKKVCIAAIFGTLQSTLTNFRYLRKIWKTNVDEERLLGVSLTGVMDHEILGDPNHPDIRKWLTILKALVIKTNIDWAKKLDIPQSAATTCIKPSGTISQLVNCSSGLHARYSRWYIRTVRADKKDPLAQFMKALGFPCECSATNSNILVFSFPIKSPEGSRTADKLTAKQQLDLWLVYQDYWCEHKPSCTVYYRDDEFLAVGNFVWNNFDKISGIAFLPYDDHIYQQAPYQPIDEDTYDAFVESMPIEVDWNKLCEYEDTDNTVSTQTLACTGGVCEIVDIV